jgi:HEAT repeat protein
VLGVALGRFVTGTPAAPQQNSEIALLREELRDTRQMVTLSLMQQQSASERLKGVTTSSQLEQPSTEVVSALLETLKRDPNVNVRLASVDALRRFGNRDAVRKSVVEALPDQESPLVQIAMVDFILESAGPEAKSVLQRLVEDMMLNQAVRDRAARGLQRVGL